MTDRDDETPTQQGNHEPVAGPLLIEAQRVLSTAQGVPAKRQKQCLEALVTLYESWDKAAPGKGRDAKAAEWNAKLRAIKPPVPPTPEKKS